MSSAARTPSERFAQNVHRKSAAVLKQRVLEQQRAELAWTMDAMSADDSAEKAAAALVSSRRRLIVGTGRSYGLASLLATDLSAGLSGVELLDGATRDFLTALTDQRAGDVLFAISLSRYRRETVDFAREYAQRGGRLILLTDSPNAPLAGLADVRVIVRPRSASYTNSPTSVALALHLIATLTIAASKGAGRRLRERDELTDHLDLLYRAEPT